MVAFRVRAAVQAIDGAGWINVEQPAWPTDGAGPAEVDAAKWLRVWAQGNSRPVAGPEWDQLRDRVRGAALGMIG
jgi:hypothetical protein